MPQSAHRDSAHHMKTSSLAALERIYVGSTPQVRRKLRVITAGSGKTVDQRPLSSARTVNEEKRMGLTGSETQSHALLSTRMQTTDAGTTISRGFKKNRMKDISPSKFPMPVAQDPSLTKVLKRKKFIIKANQRNKPYVMYNSHQK